MAKKQIIYNIGFNVNNANLKTVQDELHKISKMTLKDIKIIDKEKAKSELNSIKESAEQLGRALEASYNPKIDSINIQKFNQSLKESGTDLNKVAINLQKVDDGGVQSFRNLTAELLTTKKEIKQTSKLLDSMATTFFNTVKWSISSSALNAFTGTIQKAWSYSQKLDESLNDIRIVTGKSNEEMEKFAKNANRAAKELKAGTTNFTNAALIYYQQGLGEEDVQARANVTVKAANVTGQSASEVSEQLTAVWNGYKVVAEEAELYVDKLAAVAATTAADLEELSTGMSKVASAANAMGVDVDQLSAQLATIVSVTRQDASVVGTALKTIYSRMGDLQVDGVDEFGTSLGDVSGKLKQMGIDVLDQEGNLRDMGNVIEEVAAKWGTWTDAQQQAAAVAIAGKRQYNNLIALFENWDMYESAKGTSQTSAGTLQKQQDIYADSLAAKLKNISTAAERVYDALFDSESMKDMLDTVAELIDKFGSFTEAIGGGGNLLGMLGSLGMRVFNEQITKGIFNTISNLGIMKANLDENINRLKIVDQYKDLLKDPEGKDKATIDKMVKIREQELKLSKYLSEEEKKQLEFNIKMTAEIANQRDEEKAKFDEAEAFYKKHFNGMAIGGPEAERNSDYRVTRKSAASDLRERSLELVGGDKSLEKYFKAQYDTIAQRYDKQGHLIVDTSKISKSDLTRMRGDIEALNQKKEKEGKLSQKEANDLKILQKKVDIKTAELKVSGQISKLTADNSKLDAKTKNKLIELAKEGKVTEERIVELLKESADYYDLQAHNIEKNADNVKKLDQNEKDLEKTNKKIFDAQKIKIFTSEIINLTSSIAAVSNGIKILSNIKDIAVDNSLTEAERIEQTIQAVSTGFATMAPGVISSLNAIKLTGVDAGTKIQKAFGWISLIMMAVTAIVSIGAEIYKSMDHRTELEKAQDNFNAISETAKQAKDRLAELRKEYSGLMSDISRYRDAKTAIEEMRVGTEEWQNAVEELNQQVEDLLIKYPELKENLTKDKDGVYQIDESVVSQVAKQQREDIKNQELLVAGTDLMAAASNENVKKREAEDRLQNIVSLSYTPGDPEGYSSYDNSIYTAIGVSSVKDLGSEASKAEYNKNKNAIESVFGEYGEIDSKRYTGWDTFKIDVDKLTKASEGQLETLKENIAKNEEFSEEQKRIYTEYIDAIKQNKNSLDNASEQTEALKEAYLTQFADKNGIDSEVLKNFMDAKGYSIDTSNIKAVVSDHISGNKLEWMEDGSNYSVNIGKVIDDDKGWFENTQDKAQVGGWINKVIKSTYGDSVKSTSLNLEELLNTNLSDLGNHTIEVNGEKMTINTLLSKYEGQKLEKKISENTEALTTGWNALIEQGRIGEAVYYDSTIMGENSTLKWDDATIEKLTEIYGYDSTKYAAAGTAKTALEKFITDSFDEFGSDPNINAFSKLTETQIQHLKNSINASNLAGAGDSIKNLVQNITDPQQMVELQALLDKVNWTDPDSVNQFRAGLIEAGIETENLGNDWDSFIKNVNSGMKQWISNSKKVGENLAYIRDTVEGIEMGSLISDEEYKKMVQINPEVAKYFVKTAGGMIAIANGKDIARVLKDQYSDLGGIKGYFENITTAVNNGTAKGNNFLKQEDVKDKDPILKYINEDRDGFINTAVALGLGEQKYIQDLISQAEDGNSGAIDLLSDMIMSVNQARRDVENGEYNSSAAQQVYGTSVARSWKEANEGITKDNGAWADNNTKNKVLDYWKTTYLSELGLNLSQNLIKDFDIDELEEAAIAFRKLELDYFKQYENELNKINVLSERVFGTQKQGYLNQVVEQEKDSAETAREIATGSRNAFKTIVAKSGFENYYNNGKLNYTALYDAIANGTVDQGTANSIIDQYNKVIDAEQKTVESADKVIDAQIAAFKYAYEVQDQINQSLRAWRDFQTDWKSSLSEFGESELTKNVQGALNILHDEATDFGFNLDKLGMYSNIGNGVNTINPYYDSTSRTFNQEQFRADWQAEIEDAQQSLEKMQGALQTMYESYLSAQDELLEVYDKEINKLQKVNSILKSSADLAKMMGLSTASYYENIVDSNLKSYNFALGQLDTMQDEYDKIFNQDGTRKADFSKEMGDKVIENLATAGENVLAKGQELYTAISDQFANKLQAMFDEYSGIAGLSLSNASEDWSMGLAKENRYLDEVNEAYARSQLNRDFQKVIDETDSVSAKNRLLEKQLAIETKLTTIKEAQGKLSQADLDRANAEFELELKRIALEEAQQTANKMKLTRDASGNYSYQYVADQDAIAKAEEELAAAENNLYNMDKDRTQSLVSEYYSTMIEAQQKIAEAQAAGDMARVERYKEYYFGANGLISGIQKELGFAADNLDAMGTSLMGSNWTSGFEDLTTALSESGLEKLVGNGDGSLASLITTTSSSMDILQGSLETLLGEGGALSTLPNKITASIDETEITNKVTELSGLTTQLINELPGLIDAVDNLKQRLDTEMVNYKDYVDKNTSELNSNTQAVKDLKDSVTDMRRSLENGVTLTSNLGEEVYISFDQSTNDTQQ